MSEKKYIDADYLRQIVMPIKDHTGKIESIVLYKDVEAAPAADVEEVKHGKWIREWGFRECSICHYCFDENDNEGNWISENYCPFCGAKMDGKDKGE